MGLFKQFLGSLQSSRTANLIGISLSALSLLTVACEPKKSDTSVATFCKQNLNSIGNIIIVDRTTEWTNKETESFKNGITEILNSEFFLGKLNGVAVSSQVSDSETQDLDTCILPLSFSTWVNIEQQLRSKKDFQQKGGASESESSKLTSIKHCPQYSDETNDLFKLRKNERICNPIRNNKGIDTSIDGAQTLTNQIVGKVSKAKNRSESTELVETIHSKVASLCKGKIECRVAVFSDLIDSKMWSKLGAEGNSSQDDIHPSSMAIQVAQDNILNYGKISSKLTILVWGAGRTETDLDIDLPASEYYSLKEFWTSYFNGISSQSPCVHIDREIPNLDGIPVSEICN